MDNYISKTFFLIGPGILGLPVWSLEQEKVVFPQVWQGNVEMGLFAAECSWHHVWQGHDVLEGVCVTFCSCSDHQIQQANHQTGIIVMQQSLLLNRQDQGREVYICMYMYVYPQHSLCFNLSHCERSHRHQWACTCSPVAINPIYSVYSTAGMNEHDCHRLPP